MKPKNKLLFLFCCEFLFVVCLGFARAETDSGPADLQSFEWFYRYGTFFRPHLASKPLELKQSQKKSAKEVQAHDLKTVPVAPFFQNQSSCVALACPGSILLGVGF